MSERDLAAATTGEVVVDHGARIDHQLGRNRAHAGRGRHREACLHVRDYSSCCALERNVDVVGLRCGYWSGLRCGSRFRGGRLGRVWCRHRGCRLGSNGLRGLGGVRGLLGGRVALEELPPGRVDAALIGQELLVDLVYQPFIWSESGGCSWFIRHVVSLRQFTRWAEPAWTTC